jgi:hypothetical protein
VAAVVDAGGVAALVELLGPGCRADVQLLGPGSGDVTEAFASHALNALGFGSAESRAAIAAASANLLREMRALGIH